MIGREDELDAAGLVADEVNLLRPERFAAGPVELLAMTRYRAHPAPARAELDGEGLLRLTFERPQRAVTPGQLVALLDPDGVEVLGAATIHHTV